MGGELFNSKTFNAMRNLDRGRS